MQGREFAITQALARHALYAAADLPKDHAQRKLVRHQVDRLFMQLAAQEQHHEAQKIASLLKWFDDGAIRSTEQVVLS